LIANSLAGNQRRTDLVRSAGKASLQRIYCSRRTFPFQSPGTACFHFISPVQSSQMILALRSSLSRGSEFHNLWLNSLARFQFASISDNHEITLL